jgi:DNA repair protein RadA/Sms
MAAVLSSNFDLAIDSQITMAGEVGLSGEIRPINRIEQRIAEAEKLGFRQMIIPMANAKSIDARKRSIQLFPVGKVEEAFRILFKNNE